MAESRLRKIEKMECQLSDAEEALRKAHDSIQALYDEIQMPNWNCPVCGAWDDCKPGCPWPDVVVAKKLICAYFRRYKITRPTIVCLCGSTRFREAFKEANLRETVTGKIVLSIGCDLRSDDAIGMPEDAKKSLDVLHLRKIDLADEVLILNVDGYIGESTGRELEYAKKHGKRIRFLEEIEIDAVKL